MTIPAITIWQPWASLIAIGAKPYEFRRWPAPQHFIGQRIAIHAGARKMRREEIQDLLLRVEEPESGHALVAHLAKPLLDVAITSPGRLELSHVVCTAILGEPRLATALYPDSDRVDHHIWAWPLTGIERLAPPTPAKGAQGFWKWNEAPGGEG